MKISKNLCFMYRQNFKNFPKNVQNGAGMRWKNQNFFGWPIWPPKMPNLFGLANHASKNAKFVWIGPKITIFAQLSTNKQCHNSFPIHPISISTCCTQLPSAFLLCSYNRSHWFELVSSVQDNKQIRNSENSCGHRVAPQSWIFFGSVYTIFIWPTVMERAEYL